MSDVCLCSGTDDRTRIDPEGLRDLMCNHKLYNFDHLLIADARYDYEWDGGHIDGSWNIRSIPEMHEVYKEFRDSHSCVVFHCEHSVDRGPRLMSAFRALDRDSNEYPVLSYPTIYLLDGGYKRFYRECQDLCVKGYRPMNDPEFVRSGALKESHAAYMRDMMEPRRPRLQRSQSCASPMVLFDFKRRS
jgi:M-phase inducer tyrosine phosphatase